MEKTETRKEKGPSSTGCTTENLSDLPSPSIGTNSHALLGPQPTFDLSSPFLLFRSLPLDEFWPDIKLLT
jgi:hypothetical protein